jgi:large subunit ribosomal protein L29
MRPRDIRRRESGDLEQETVRLRQEIFQKRFHGHSEDKGDRGLIRKNRRDVARILTVLNERARAAKPAAAGKASGR